IRGFHVTGVQTCALPIWFLARGPSQRLTAEMIRDNALAASGLLNEKIGGPSVKPYQPPGLWEINNTHYTADTTDAVYRRSVYVKIGRATCRERQKILGES